MTLWIVLVRGLWRSCYECDGGGLADYYFVAAPTRRDAMDMVHEHRMANAEPWKHDEEARRRQDDYRAVAIRPWRGRQRFVHEREVELA